MRVLVVSPTPTHPADQGNRARVRQVAEGLVAAGAVVDVLYYAIDGTEAAGLEAMRRHWGSLTVVPLEGFVPRRSLAQVWAIDDWVSPSLLRAARGLAAAIRYDAVVVNYVWCSEVLDCFPRGPGAPLRIIDTHDAFGQRLELMQANGLLPHWYYTSVAEEARGLDRADIVIAIQHEEAAYFAGITRAEVRTIGFARTATATRRVAGAQGRLRVGYLGSNNPWNRRSIEVLDAELDRAWHRFPAGREPRVLIYGSVADKLPGLRRCMTMGRVKDVGEVYRQVDVMINPMVGGTGLKIKTVEALSYGVPILSTLAGGVGLEDLHPDFALRDVEALVARLVGLTGDLSQLMELTQSMLPCYNEISSKATASFQNLLQPN